MFAPVALLLALASPPQDALVERVLTLLRQRRDTVEAEVLHELAAAGTSAALQGLREAVTLLQSPALLEEAYLLALRFGAEPGLAAEALAWLERDALGAEGVRRLAAATALAEWGDGAVAALQRVSQHASDPAVRATVLGPLLPGLRLEGSAASLERILADWRAPESGDAEAAVRTLAGFRGPEHVRRLAEAADDRSRAADIRELALEALVRHPSDSAVHCLCKRVADSEGRARAAALGALGRRAGPDVARELERYTDHGPPEVRAAAWIGLAGRTTEDVRYTRRLELLARHQEPVLRAAAATVLGRCKFEAAVPRLAALLNDADVSVREAAREACRERRDPALVVALFERLDFEPVAGREALRSALVALTATDHGTSSARWRAWWTNEGSQRPLATPAEAAAFEAARAARSGGADRSTVQFYGIPVDRERVVFVVDTSGSMQSATTTKDAADGGRTRHTTAQARLRETLERLPPGTRFNVIWFADSVEVWRNRVVERTPANLRQAQAAIERRAAEGGTALYDGLVRAWHDRQVEAIYLLSDGAPSAGTLTDPAAILAEVRRRHKARPVTVHCISIGTESALLRELAALTGGVYRVVQ